MDPIAPLPNPLNRDALWQQGLPAASSEHGLRTLVHLSGAFCGAVVVLALMDRAGLWFCEGAGLTPDQLTRLEPFLRWQVTRAERERAIRGLGLVPVEEFRLTDGDGEALAFLLVTAPEPLQLLPTQSDGLRLLAEQIGGMVAQPRAPAEERLVGRGPGGASFVPGLVHEMRNFIFGITASLDAFQVRCADLPETAKYGKILRTSVDRLNSFMEELRAFGDPRLGDWADLPLEPLLHRAIGHHLELAERNQVDIRLQINGQLPPIRMDQERLQTAFLRLINLAIEQESAGGCVVVQVGVRAQGERSVVFGHLDGSGMKLHGMDLVRLFEPFYFRHPGLERLGLPMARRIFEAHGGNLGASPGPEGGLRLGFMLPASDPKGG